MHHCLKKGRLYAAFLGNPTKELEMPRRKKDFTKKCRIYISKENGTNQGIVPPQLHKMRLENRPGAESPCGCSGQGPQDF